MAEDHGTKQADKESPWTALSDVELAQELVRKAHLMKLEQKLLEEDQDPVHLRDDLVNIANEVACRMTANDSDDRRRTLKKLGIYGFYTAPALLAMLTADKAMAVSGGIISGGGGGGIGSAKHVFFRQGPVL
jgi:hypothetical protein